MTIISMNRRSASTHPVLALYSSAATRALARITVFRHRSQKARGDTRKARLGAEKMLKKKSKFTRLKDSLRMMAGSMAPSTTLVRLLSATRRQPPPRMPKAEPALATRYPRIEVPRMDWVMQNISEITAEGFGKAEESIRKQKESLAALRATLTRYGDKLRVVEDKLVRGYEEVRSKRRYF
jgi:hypothetical protein